MRADAEALYNANQRGLFRYFVRAVGHAETARDLTQDVFVRVSRSVIPTAPEAALQGLAVPDRQEPGPGSSPQRQAATAGRAADRYGPAGVAGHERRGQRSSCLADRRRSRRVPDARGRRPRLRRDRHGVRTDAGRRAIAHSPGAPATARSALDADCGAAHGPHAPVGKVKQQTNDSE